VHVTRDDEIIADHKGDAGQHFPALAPGDFQTFRRGTWLPLEPVTEKVKQHEVLPHVGVHTHHALHGNFYPHLLKDFALQCPYEVFPWFHVPAGEIPVAFGIEHH
jgi:hypothetical protein